MPITYVPTEDLDMSYNLPSSIASYTPSSNTQIELFTRKNNIYIQESKKENFLKNLGNNFIEKGLVYEINPLQDNQVKMQSGTIIGKKYRATEDIRIKSVQMQIGNLDYKKFDDSGNEITEGYSFDGLNPWRKHPVMFTLARELFSKGELDNYSDYVNSTPEGEAYKKYKAWKNSLTTPLDLNNLTYVNYPFNTNTPLFYNNGLKEAFTNDKIFDRTTSIKFYKQEDNTFNVELTLKPDRVFIYDGEERATLIFKNVIETIDNDNISTLDFSNSEEVDVDWHLDTMYPTGTSIPPFGGIGVISKRDRSIVYLTISKYKINRIIRNKEYLDIDSSVYINYSENGWYKYPFEEYTSHYVINRVFQFAPETRTLSIIRIKPEYIETLIDENWELYPFFYDKLQNNLIGDGEGQIKLGTFYIWEHGDISSVNHFTLQGHTELDFYSKNKTFNELNEELKGSVFTESTVELKIIKINENNSKIKYNQCGVKSWLGGYKNSNDELEPFKKYDNTWVNDSSLFRIEDDTDFNTDAFNEVTNSYNNENNIEIENFNDPFKEVIYQKNFSLLKLLLLGNTNNSLFFHELDQQITLKEGENFAITFSVNLPSSNSLNQYPELSNHPWIKQGGNWNPNIHNIINNKEFEQSLIFYPNNITYGGIDQDGDYGNSNNYIQGLGLNKGWYISKKANFIGYEKISLTSSAPKLVFENYDANGTFDAVFGSLGNYPIDSVKLCFVDSLDYDAEDLDSIYMNFEERSEFNRDSKIKLNYIKSTLDIPSTQDNGQDETGLIELYKDMKTDEEGNQYVALYEPAVNTYLDIVPQRAWSIWSYKVNYPIRNNEKYQTQWFGGINSFGDYINHFKININNWFTENLGNKKFQNYYYLVKDVAGGILKTKFFTYENPNYLPPELNLNSVLKLEDGEYIFEVPEARRIKSSYFTVIDNGDKIILAEGKNTFRLLEFEWNGSFYINRNGFKIYPFEDKVYIFSILALGGIATSDPNLRNLAVSINSKGILVNYYKKKTDNKIKLESDIYNILFIIRTDSNKWVVNDNLLGLENGNTFYSYNEETQRYEISIPNNIQYYNNNPDLNFVTYIEIFDDGTGYYGSDGINIERLTWSPVTGFDPDYNFTSAGIAYMNNAVLDANGLIFVPEATDFVKQYMRTTYTKDNQILHLNHKPVFTDFLLEFGGNDNFVNTAFNKTTMQHYRFTENSLFYLNSANWEAAFFTELASSTIKQHLRDTYKLKNQILNANHEKYINSDFLNFAGNDNFGPTFFRVSYPYYVFTQQGIELLNNLSISDFVFALETTQPIRQRLRETYKYVGQVVNDIEIAYFSDFWKNWPGGNNSDPAFSRPNFFRFEIPNYKFNAEAIFFLNSPNWEGAFFVQPENVGEEQFTNIKALLRSTYTKVGQMLNGIHVPYINSDFLNWAGNDSFPNPNFFKTDSPFYTFTQAGIRDLKNPAWTNLFYNVENASEALIANFRQTYNNAGEVLNANQELLVNDIYKNWFPNANYPEDYLIKKSFAVLSDIVETAVSSPNLTKLVELLTGADLVNTVKAASNVTVLAPLDSAFEDISGVLPTLTSDEVSNILLSHIIALPVLSNSLTDGQEVDTLGSLKLTVKIENGEVFFLPNNVETKKCKVLTANLEVFNGIIHLLDKVLLP